MNPCSLIAQSKKGDVMEDSNEVSNENVKPKRSNKPGGDLQPAQPAPAAPPDPRFCRIDRVGHRPGTRHPAKRSRTAA